MKTNHLFTAIAVSGLLLIPASCVGNKKKADVNPASEQLATKIVEPEKSKTEIPQQIVEIASQQKEVKTDTTRIDSEKIYEESEVTRAVCPLSDAQIIKHFTDNFKYPDSITVDGRIWTDIIIEKDGSISDVLIVEGLHPALDKEAIRVLKLLPKFTPGKYKGIPVRSKFRSPVRCMVM